ncbi:MAG: MoaD/ThiS family protein [Armatimonadetes bacterium]|nr:MoaD/ThiS family protein [Armatimonadota bacterium]
MPTLSIRVPLPMRRLTGDLETVEARGATVAEVLEDLESRYPGFRTALQDDEGRVRRYINVFLNADNIRELENEQTPVRDGDELSIIPAIAGGRSPESTEENPVVRRRAKPLLETLPDGRGYRGATRRAPNRIGPGRPALPLER